MIGFVLQGILIELPATVIIFHMESLGYSINEIQILDGVVNLGWFFRPWIMTELHLLYHVGGVLTWLALCFPSRFIFAFMFLSESCIAFNQTCLDHEGMSPMDMRKALLGRVIGSSLGGVLYRMFGSTSVYTLEALLFCVFIPLTHYFPTQPRAPVEKRPDDETQSRMAVFLILLSMLPDAGMPLFFFESDKLGFTSIEFAVLDGLGTLGTLIGTYIHVDDVALWFMLSCTVNASVLIMLVSRWAIGIPPLLLLIPCVLTHRVLGSALVTQYTIGANKNVAFWSTLPMVGQVCGASLSMFLVHHYHVDHSHYGNLLLLVYIVAFTLWIPIIYLLMSKLPLSAFSFSYALSSEAAR